MTQSRQAGGGVSDPASLAAMGVEGGQLPGR